MELLGLRNFPIRPPNVDERVLPGESPTDFVERLARSKASAKATVGEIVLGADTIVLLDGEIIGKPENPSEAAAMLRRLQNRHHEVLSGVALCRPEWNPSLVSGVEQTSVFFGPMSPEEIDTYVATEEPMDKAGAYAIQGIGAIYVQGIQGNYHNVMGLPLPLVCRLGRELGWNPLDHAP